MIVITVPIGFDTMAKPDAGVFLLGLWTPCAIPFWPWCCGLGGSLLKQRTHERVV